MKHTITWVVEVPATDTALLSWRPEDVRAACDLSDGGGWTWQTLDADALNTEDSMSLRVWREYRDGVKQKATDD